MSVLAEARRDLVRRNLPVRLNHDRGERMFWAAHGMTLAQRDRAVEELVTAGAAKLKTTRFGIEVEPTGGERGHERARRQPRHR